MNEATFTPESDVLEPFSDGNGSKIIVKAGQPTAWATAYELGLVTTKHPPKDDKPVKRVKSADPV